MISIVNIDKNVRKSGPHEYELKINDHVITRFTHNKEDPLHECLLKAAIAAEEKATPARCRCGTGGRGAIWCEVHKCFTGGFIPNALMHC